MFGVNHKIVYRKLQICLSKVAKVFRKKMRSSMENVKKQSAFLDIAFTFGEKRKELE